MEHAPSAGAPPAPESPRCAVCGSREVAPWFRTDFGTMGRCGGCGQVLRYDLPSSEAMVDLHRAGDLHETPYAELRKPRGMR